MYRGLERKDEERSASLMVGTFLLSLLLTVPMWTHAQSVTTATSTELQATIRTALISDPRSAGMSQAQLDAMVAALSAQAQKSNMTSHDILWRPQPTQGFTAAANAPGGECDNVPAILCALNTAFGFAGSDATIPIWLGITSALLLILIFAIIEIHHKHLREKLTLGVATSAKPVASVTSALPGKGKMPPKSV